MKIYRLALITALSVFCSSHIANAKCSADFKRMALSKEMKGCEFVQIESPLIDLSGFNFESVRFINSVLDNAKMTDSKFADFQLYNGSAQGADFSKSEFFTMTLRLSEKRLNAFEDVDLRGANFSNTTFGSEANWSMGLGNILKEPFSGSNISGANFSGAYFASSGTFNSVIAVKSNFNQSNFAIGGEIYGSDFSGSSFVDADLSEVDSRRSLFVDSDFTEADLSSSDFSDADFSKAKFINADLTEANLSKANLSGADLTGANLTGAILTEANLCNATAPDGAILFIGCE